MSSEIVFRLPQGSQELSIGDTLGLRGRLTERNLAEQNLKTTAQDATLGQFGSRESGAQLIVRGCGLPPRPQREADGSSTLRPAPHCEDRSPATTA